MHVVSSIDPRMTLFAGT